MYSVFFDTVLTNEVTNNNILKRRVLFIVSDDLGEKLTIFNKDE